MLAALALAVSPAWTQAQPRPAQPVAFEVASVKPHAADDRTLMPPTVLPGGRFVAKFPASMLISYAYRLPDNPSLRLTGVPDWSRGDRRTMAGFYDIEAMGKMPAGMTAGAREDRMRSMVQALLADRFRLAIHRETKEMPVYALVQAKGGSKLRKADVEEIDCPEASAPPTAPTAAALRVCHVINGGRGRGIHAWAVNMSDLARFVENWTDRPLLDKTGLTGLYQIETTGWLPMDAIAAATPGAKAEDGTDMADVPTVFQLFERLGLKMEAQTGKADLYVVDHIERPSEN